MRVAPETESRAGRSVRARGPPPVPPAPSAGRSAAPRGLAARHRRSRISSCSVTTMRSAWRASAKLTRKAHQMSENVEPDEADHRPGADRHRTVPPTTRLTAAMSDHHQDEAPAREAAVRRERRLPGFAVACVPWSPFYPIAAQEQEFMAKATRLKPDDSRGDLPPLPCGRSRAQGRTQFGQPLHLAGGRGALGPGHRRGRQPRHQAALRHRRHARKRWWRWARIRCGTTSRPSVSTAARRRT